MTIIAVTNAAIFDSDEAEPSSMLRFEGSPGDIMSNAAVDDTDSVIDGTGCTLLPAFIDCHIDAAAVNSAPQIFASFGIATVIDMVSEPCLVPRHLQSRFPVTRNADPKVASICQSIFFQRMLPASYNSQSERHTYTDSNITE